MSLETFSRKKLWIEFSGRGTIFTEKVLQSRAWPKPNQMRKRYQNMRCRGVELDMLGCFWGVLG